MDFIAGVATLLKPTGMATFEFPRLLRLIEEVQFDTIYHEHYSYYNLSTVKSMFHSVGLDVVDVEEIPSAGGSLRIFLKLNYCGIKPDLLPFTCDRVTHRHGRYCPGRVFPFLHRRASIA